jgi:predicted DNA-binding transcriptional regulator YafY
MFQRFVAPAVPAQGRANTVLRFSGLDAARARPIFGSNWRFHAGQVLEEGEGGTLVRFRASGLRELADHLFTWGGEVRIREPEALRVMMRERLAAGEGALATFTP